MPEEMTAEQFEMLLQMAVIAQPPYLLAGLGLLMGVLCGLTFSRLVQLKLDGWKQDRLTLLPLGTPEITMSYTGILIGGNTVHRLLLADLRLCRRCSALGGACVVVADGRSSLGPTGALDAAGGARKVQGR